MTGAATLKRLLLVIVACSLSACAFKVGRTSFSDDSIDRQTSDPTYEIEFISPKFDLWGGRANVSISAISQKFKLEPDVNLRDYDTTLRWFPLIGDRAGLYTGIGLGSFDFRSAQEISTCPAGYICFPGQENDFRETIQKSFSKGYNPHVVIGLMVEGAMLELRHEFDKEDSGVELNSTTISLGWVIGSEP